MDCSMPSLPVHHQLPEFTQTQEMAPHSSILAWRILWTEEPGGLPSMGLQSQTQLKQLSCCSCMSIESVIPSNHLNLCHPLLLSPSIFPSIRVFSNESALWIRWPKYWSFSFNISPSNDTQGWSPLGWTGWISLRSKGLSRVFSNTTVQKHRFFSAQLSLWSNSHIHTTTGKTIALTRQNFVGKVISLFFNTLSRLVLTFLPGSKYLLISWLQSPSAVILEPRKIKSATISTVSPSISHEVMNQMPRS